MTPIKDPNLIDAEEKLKRSISLCNHRPGYQDAIEVCSSVREVWARYYAAWFMDSSFKEEAVVLGDLFSGAVEALQATAVNGRLESHQLTHVHLMIRNTKMRQRALDVIITTENKGEIVSQIRKIYKDLEAEKVDKAASFVAR